MLQRGKTAGMPGPGLDSTSVLPQSLLPTQLSILWTTCAVHNRLLLQTTGKWGVCTWPDLCNTNHESCPCRSGHHFLCQPKSLEAEGLSTDR